MTSFYTEPADLSIGGFLQEQGRFARIFHPISMQRVISSIAGMYRAKTTKKAMRYFMLLSA